MKKATAKKLFVMLTLLALTVLLTLSLIGGPTASATSKLSPSNTIDASTTTAASSSAMTAAAQAAGIIMPRTMVFALDTDNSIFVLVPGTTTFVRIFRVADGAVDGNLAGIDFRPADGNNNQLYAVTDTGKLYTIGLTAATLGRATLISTMSPAFPSGYQALMDFNPVVNAIRLIGSDALNYAVVNSAGNLNATAVQTSLTYATGDPFAGQSPKVSAGAYNNNFVGSTVTLFYGIDNFRDTLFTIQPAAAGGSSATGGGVCQTLGNLVNPAGARVKVSPTADFDIYTLRNGTNRLVGVSGRTFFTIDLGAINTVVPVGQLKNVVVNGIAAAADTGGRLIDVAAASTRYEAENALLGGGNIVDTSIAGFTGTGFVNYTDNLLGGFTEFQVAQAGTQTLSFRYS